MPVTTTGTPTGYKANNTSFSFSHTVAVGTDCLGVGVASWGGTVTAVTAGGVSMTQVSGSSGTWDGTAGHISHWILRSPSSGAQTIAFTSGTASELSAGAINFTGVDTSSDANAASGGTTANGTSTGPSVTTSGTPTSDDLVVDVIGWYNANVSAVGADQTSQIDQSSGDSRTTVAMSTQSGSISPATMSWTLNGSVAWGASTVIIKAAAATTAVLASVVSPLRW